MDIILGLSAAIGICLAMSVGVNTLGSTVGIIRGGTNLNYKTAAVASTLAAIIGILLLSNKIVDTVSRDLIKLNASGMLAVLIAVSVIAVFLAIKEAPISTTYVVIGALSGYGFAASGNPLNFALWKEVIVAILASPFIALLIGFAAFYSVKNL